MKFSAFIAANLDEIVAEWEAFARTLPAAQSMSSLALRDHCRLILSAIVADMETEQTDEEQAAKSMCTDPPDGPGESAAEAHGTLRHLAGFDLVELVAEFRAMRASVLSLWHRSDHSRVVGGAIDEITRFNEGIDQALAESVERYSANVAASRDMFLGVLGHDLRGPLSVIAMSNQVLAAASLPPLARQRACERVGRAIRDMQHLIEDLLDYTRSRLGAGIPIERSACDLGPICREALDAIQASHPQRPVALTLTGDLRAQADAPKMRQALGNLLSNAVQHGDGREPIGLSVTSDEDTLYIRVSNSGPPIPAESRRAIFEPLVQLTAGEDDTDDLARTSMGLGLFIVREIINGHQGSIAVESSAEAGTVFSVRLPRWMPQ